MTTVYEAPFIAVCLEGFLYGLYSGIFAMYLHCTSKRSGTVTALTLFYAVCLLYVLSAASFVSDLLALILETRALLYPLQIDSGPILFRVLLLQTTANGCCDFLAQCILIYRCWIVWGHEIRVVIIPSFLAIAYLATWIGQLGASIYEPGGYEIAGWGGIVTLTALAASMAVNTLVTGLIVFKILKVFLEVNPSFSSDDMTLRSTGVTKFRHIIFVIIESGMALFAFQLIRLVFFLLEDSDYTDFAIVIDQMLNGIVPTIILVLVSMKLSFDDTESFKEAAGSLHLNNPPSDPNTSSIMITTTVTTSDQ